MDHGEASMSKGHTADDYRQAIEKYGSRVKAARALGVNPSSITKSLKRADFVCDSVLF